MFGAIDGSMILEIMDKYYSPWEQLPLFKTPPEFTLDEAFLTDVPLSYKEINETGLSHGWHSHIDHPSFDHLRKMLSSRGYIRIETTYWNGDRVLKTFRLNGKWFDPGDKFPCASAMGVMLRVDRKLAEQRQREEQEAKDDDYDF